MPNKKPIKSYKHPWRACPLGEHWRGDSNVKGHIRKKRRVRAHFRKGSCVLNSSHKDQIYEDEITAISKREFSKLEGDPFPDNLTYSNGNKYDALIRGWTKYWNDVFKSVPTLNANLAKALIASESSFDATIETKKKNKEKRAYGLMQVLGSTLKILADEKGELKDHYVNVKLKNLKDPSLNIAVGIRWLFRKFEIAKSKNKKADWIDAIAEYKSFPREHKEMKRLIALYEKLEKAKNDAPKNTK